MNIIDLTNHEFSNDRAELRKELINLFLQESPGQGTGDQASKYKYIVKQLNDGKNVFLSRPANLNNGFDFTLNVENINFNEGLTNDDGRPKRASTRPTHQNILEDLSAKKSENFSLYSELMEQIDLIFNCQEPTKTNLPFSSGHPSDLILECLKWLFIEQDVTYWNNSGRGMLYGHIKEI
jgi:hypothetical protein